jgi:hypothetical protein
MSTTGPWSQVNNLTTSFFNINIKYLILSWSNPSGFFHSDFKTKTVYVFLTYPKRAICPAHLIIQDCITLIISGEGYKL